MPITAYDINSMPEKERRTMLTTLIPPVLFEKYSIDRETFHNPSGSNCVKFTNPLKMPFFQVEIWRDPADRDPLMFLDISTTAFAQMEISFIVVNDPETERYNIDLDENGRDTYYGTVRRNISEEMRAMEAGLAPGQVRRGLRLMKHLIAIWESFFANNGHRFFFLEPLGYYSAILYEKYGFDHIKGKERMKFIHREFQEGGILWGRLDGSTPFRKKGMEKTVRGRAWAIHDGILDDPWVSPKMYKTIGVHAGVCTFPDFEF